MARSISWQTMAGMFLGLSRGRFQDQFIVDLEEEAQGKLVAIDAALDVDHGALDQVGGAALDDGVDGQPLAQAAGVAVGGVDLGDGATAARQGGDVAILQRLLDAPLEEAVDAREPLLVSRDQAGGAASRSSPSMRRERPNGVTP